MSEWAVSESYTVKGREFVCVMDMDEAKDAPPPICSTDIHEHAHTIVRDHNAVPKLREALRIIKDGASRFGFDAGAERVLEWVQGLVEAVLKETGDE